MLFFSVEPPTGAMYVARPGSEQDPFVSLYSFYTLFEEIDAEIMIRQHQGLPVLRLL